MNVSEAAQLMGVSTQTASKYIRQLDEQGIVEKIMPSASRQSHYYILKE